MSIDVEPKKIKGVVQLVVNTEGWSRQQTRYLIDRTKYVGGNPGAYQNYTPVELTKPLQAAYNTTREKRPTDFNGPKVAVTRLAFENELLITEGIRTDYFTLWGLPQAAPELFAEHESKVVINRADKSSDALYLPALPWGICSHNTLLDANGDLFVMVRSRSQGFHSGRLSATEEEQTELEDSSVFATSARSFLEELKLRIPQNRIRLLGIAEEKGAAYPAYAFVTETNLSPQAVINRWRGINGRKPAQDYSENTAILLIPSTQIERWASQNSIDPETWGPHLLAGTIDQDATIELHPTSSWRMSLARSYSQLAA